MPSATNPPPPPLAEPSCRAFQFHHPVSVWQAEEAVANLPLRLEVRVHCGRPSSAGYSRGTRSLQGYTGVLTAYSTGAHSLYGYTAMGRHAARNALLPAERAFPSFFSVLECACAAE
jgi:hypothetical protein